ncbi:MAG: ATP-binding protein [Gammaproteobacteria bacterium]
MTDKDLRLLPEQLYRHCDLTLFDFETTESLQDIEETLGQHRALQAIRFGVGIQQPGYNLYVLGHRGRGRHSTVKSYLQDIAAQQDAPADWCYINNFKQPHKPYYLQLPAGRGTSLQHDMLQLIEDLHTVIPAAFEAEEYHARLHEVEETLKEQAEKQFSELAHQAEEHHITLLRTPHGFAFAPVKDDKVISPEDFDKLSEKERDRIDQIIAVLEEKLQSILRQQPQWQRQGREQVKALNREVAIFAIGHLIEDLKARYSDLPKVVNYLQEVEEDIIEHFNDFRREEGSTPALFLDMESGPTFTRYHVNVIVDNSKVTGAPVIYEDSPLYPNLIGCVEHMTRMGTLTTDFTLIKPGALHRANGGYLILDVDKVLSQPFAWEGLKQVLASNEISIQSLGQLYSLISTQSLEPEAIPLNIKIVLVGDRRLYYLLYEYDPEFAELFKVEADFEDEIDRHAENDMLYARMIATLARRNQLKPLDRAAVGRVIEHAARLVEDTEKLSTGVASISDLIREADYWAAQNQQGVIRREDVQHALDQQTYRAERYRQRLYEEIKRGAILIDTEGERVAQVNGLAVIQMGRFAFAQPSRITATARLGDGEMVDIEREVELGGSLHTKGVFILSAFLATRYAKDRPLSLASTLVFEQSYGMIDGDSASMAELCALLSALADIPIKQSLAITGSVNQHGESQVIGGVNEKVEGFFGVCKTRGLNGSQGVLIPANNSPHLMLHQEVTTACRDGQFHLYIYHNVDEAMHLLTGLPSGERDADGQYPQGSINRRVEDRLIELENLKEKFKAREKEADDEDDDNDTADH